MYIVYFVGGPWDLTKRAYPKHPPSPIQVHEMVIDADRIPAPDGEVMSVHRIHEYQLSPLPIYWDENQFMVGIYAPD